MLLALIAAALAGAVALSKAKPSTAQERSPAPEQGAKARQHALRDDADLVVGAPQPLLPVQLDGVTPILIDRRTGGRWEEA